MLTKTAMVLVKDVKTGGLVWFKHPDQNVPPEDRGTNAAMMVAFDSGLWADMDEPEEIAFTIEAGDTLN